MLWWFGFYLAYTLIMSFHGDWRKYLIIHILNIIVFVVAYYMLRYLQFPKLYQKDRKGLFLLSLLGSTFICYVIYWILRRAVFESLVPMFVQDPFVHLGEFLVRTIRFYAPAMLLIVWEFQYYRKQDQVRVRALEKEKLAIELKFLKAQINPHFLFNTLNNLYSFVLAESPKASDMLDRLTGILEYILDKAQNHQVALKLEVATIEDYLALEKIRYGDRLEVQFSVTGNLDLPISPLILLSIIENAFKHGASGDINHPKINIKIYTSDQFIHCQVWNTKSNHQEEINDAYKTGIGLSNIRRQLDLIYPKKHQLRINDEPRSFMFSLSIDIEE